MLYNCVRIDPRDDHWVISFTVDKQDREDVETLPNPGGWYHHPATMDRVEATRDLIDTMIVEHDKAIGSLIKSRSALLKLYKEV